MKKIYGVKEPMAPLQEFDCKAIVPPLTKKKYGAVDIGMAPLQEFVCQAINMPLTKKAAKPSVPSRRAASKRGTNGHSSAPVARAKKPNAKTNGKKPGKK